VRGLRCTANVNPRLHDVCALGFPKFGERGSDILLCPPPPVFRLHGQSAEGTGDSSDARSAVLLQDHDARGGRGHHPTGLWCARLKVSPLLPSLLSLLPASLTRWHSRERALKASGLILNF
jgi:hypothetical protein